MTSGARVRAAACVLAAVLLGQAQAPSTQVAQGPRPATNVRFQSISQTDLKEWLTYLSSDELQGRQVFTEGYGIAAQYIAERLREFGVKPMGDRGTYFQVVRLRSYKVTRNSSITIEANGQTRTFKDGDHVSFPMIGGGRQRLVFDGAEFAGNGANALAGRDMKGKLLLVMSPFSGGRAGRGGRGGAAMQGTGAAATLELVAVAQPQPDEPGVPGTAPATGRGRGATAPDIGPTTRRVDGVEPPRLMADDVFFSALLGAGPSSYPELRARLERGEPLPAFSLAGVRITIQVDNTYQPLTTQLTRNVVGMVEGTDARLKDSYVLFGAHLDHVGYASSSQDLKGTANTSVDIDNIWNGADDDGTGSTAAMAIAKAFASGPRPKRSVVFIWHTGEEANLYGSVYNADFPVVPIDKVQCQLNIDMIGRNRDNDPAQANTLFVIGADRISTDLHNLIVDTNATVRPALRLDYEYNDPNDPNSFYTRSDHVSYASKGIPVAFFFTGEHPDYHANSDTVDKILFDKQARITQLIYQVGYAVADSERPLDRDHRGPRAGKGFRGRIQ